MNNASGDKDSKLLKGEIPVLPITRSLTINIIRDQTYSFDTTNKPTIANSLYVSVFAP